MVKIVAQIDTPSAIRNYHDILRVSDAIMVSRTNLGMVIKPEKVGGLAIFLCHQASCLIDLHQPSGMHGECCALLHTYMNTAGWICRQTSMN
jgi:hypothetical protein